MAYNSVYTSIPKLSGSTAANPDTDPVPIVVFPLPKEIKFGLLTLPTIVNVSPVSVSVIGSSVPDVSLIVSPI